MDLRKIKKLIELVEESGVAELEVAAAMSRSASPWLQGVLKPSCRRPQYPLLNGKKQHQHRQRKLSRHQWPAFSINRRAQRLTRL